MEHSRLNVIQPSVFDGYRQLTRTPRAYSIFAFLYLCVVVAYFAYTNLATALSILSFTSLSFVEQTKLFLLVFFDGSSFSLPYLLPLVVLIGTFVALVGTQYYAYLYARKTLLMKDKLLGGFSLFLAVLGIGCAACGTLIISTLAGAFGYGALITLLPLKGLEVGYLGVALLVVLSYTLAKRLARVALC